MPGGAGRDAHHGPRAGALPVLGVLAGVAVAWVIVWPVGEYALGDDWAYVRSLRHLADEGRLTILGWNPMTLVGQLLWGLAFTGVLGFSFTATKLAVAVLFAVECLGLLAALRHFRVPPGLAAAAVATLALNPLHLVQAFTFATDVPALAGSLLAFLLYARALDGTEGGARGGSREGRRALALFALGSCCAGWAFLVRQSGVLIVAALALFVVVWDRRRLRQPRVLAAAFGPAALAVAAFWWWSRYVHGPTAMLAWWEEQVWGFVRHPDPALLARVAFALAVYLGFFLVPLSFCVRPWVPRRPVHRVALLAIGALAIAGWLALGVAGHTFPYLRNTITPFGYFRPNEILLGERALLWPAGTGWTAGLLFLGSFVVLVGAALRARETGATSGRPAGFRLLVAWLSLQLAYLLATSPTIFDRHLLLAAPAVVLLFCALAGGDVRLRVPRFAALLLPLALYGLAGSHDLHAISRTAFQAGEDLRRAGVSVRTIDAGYAFDGWHVFEVQRPGEPLRARPTDGWWVRHLFPTIRTDWVVALSPTLDYTSMAPAITGGDRTLFLTPRLDGYQVARTYPYFTYWPWGMQEMYVLRAAAPGPATP